MRKFIYILSILLLAHEISLAQYNEANTDQIGKGNIVRVEQAGHANHVAAFQKGLNNHSTLVQIGHLNKITTKQYGVRHKLFITQDGIFNKVKVNQGCKSWICCPCNINLFISINQKGKYNNTDINQKGENSKMYVEQVYKCNDLNNNLNKAYLEQGIGILSICGHMLIGCKNNFMDIYQKGKGNYTKASQKGSFNKLYVDQFGDNHYISGSQLGLDNYIYIKQNNN